MQNPHGVPRCRSSQPLGMLSTTSNVGIVTEHWGKGRGASVGSTDRGSPGSCVTTVHAQSAQHNWRTGGHTVPCSGGVDNRQEAAVDSNDPGGRPGAAPNSDTS